MNPGILASGHAPPPMPYGLLGRVTPVPSIDHRVISDPRVVPSLAAWWDASDPFSITLNGSNVSQWSDKSGNGFNLTQTTAANQPLYSRGLFGGLNAVTFGPQGTATHRLINASLRASTPTVVVVFRVQSGYVYQFGRQAVLFDTYDSSAGRCVVATGQTSFSPLVWQRGSGAADETVNLDIVRAVTNVATFGSREVGSDGVLNGTFGASAPRGAVGLAGISVGNLRGIPTPIAVPSSYVWDGNICEMMVFHSQIPDQQRRALERYLANKWGAVTA